MKVLMLVATSVAADTRVLREARALAEAGHGVHIVGRSVPTDWTPPAGITVSSVGTSSVFRAEGGASLAGQRLPAWKRLARWALLPQHRESTFRRWRAGAVADAAGRDFDIVHAHDFTALAAGAELAAQRGVGYVYDSHEFWAGLPRQYRPTPLLDRQQRREEARLGGAAAAVITVGDGVTGGLRSRYGWRHITVVRNTFDPLVPAPGLPDAPTGLLYAGLIARYRELDAVAAASHASPLPITLMGPSDGSWVAGFDPGAATVLPSADLATVDAALASNGLALVTHSDRWQNHRYALPNKLFHAVRVGVPVVATDVDELARTVRAHGLGELYRPGDPDDLLRAISAAMARYGELKANVTAARGELSWATDAARLVGLYERLAEGRT